MRLTLRLILPLSLLVMALCAEEGQAALPQADEHELERMVGNQLETPVQVSAWKTREPQRTNLFIYSVRPPQLDEALMRRVADRFGVTGEIEQIPSDTLGHVGFWIKETNPTNSAKSREVKFWLTMGNFTFSSGDDGYRYDPVKKTHPIHGVPTKDEAKEMGLKLLPLLGLSTNDLEHYANDRLRWASSGSSVSYTDRTDKQRKKIITARNVSFYQRVPGGGTTASVGDGGVVRFSFVSDGKVASIEWLFRNMVKAGETRPKTSNEIMRDVRSRNAWTWHQTLPSSITVTNCVLAYPQGNSWLNQNHVWPFYMLTGTASQGHPVTLYVPLEW